MTGSSVVRRPSSVVGSLEIAITGTGTGVGKTRVTTLLTRGLRLLGRRVWVHKPVACGGWDGSTAEDGRAIAALCGDSQPADSACPLQFPEAAAPHLAAAAAGMPIELATLRTNLQRCRGDHDLVLEGAGGLLSPLTASRGGLADLLAETGIPILVVARADLGTLNHIALTVAEARRRGLPPLGLVISHVIPDDGSLAVRTAATEAGALCGLPVLAELVHGPTDEATARSLAASVLAGRRTTDDGRRTVPLPPRPSGRR